MKRPKGYEKLLKLASRHPRPSPWWHRPDYADPEYSRRFYRVYESATAPSEAELEFFEALVHPGQALLDVGCGGGAFARAIAQRGVRVTGIDLGPYPIEQARRLSREASIEAEWICGNILEHDFGRQFDCITLLGTQLQEFPPEELERLFGKVHSLLAPGGRFVSEVERWSLEERQYSSYWYLPEVCLYTDKKALVLGENFYYPEERIRILREYALELPTGRLWIGGSTEKEYLPDELDALLQKAGLRLAATYGDWDRSPLTPESTRAISVVEHR